MVGDQRNLTVDEIMNDTELSEEILDIAGHYTFNDDEVKVEIEKLFANLAKFNVDGHRFVVDYLKRPLREYAECYNLKGVTSRILDVLKVEA